MSDPRRVAVKTLQAVFAGQSLASLSLQPAEQVLIYGVLRQRRVLMFYRDSLLTQPLKPRDEDINLLLLISLWQLTQDKKPNYAVVSEAVNTAQRLKKWSKGLVNAVLRNFIRQRETLDQRLSQQSLAVRYSLPDWLYQHIHQDWPELDLAALNEPGPMTLRVNVRQVDRLAYQQQLAQLDIQSQTTCQVPSGLVLVQPVSVDELPAFDQGACSVQDAAAQQAAFLLNPQEGERLLDACAAPGGKTGHLLERAHIMLTAIDQDALRTQRINENLQRLQLQADVITADVLQPDQWWNGELFDAILLDVPCSATGVIRRHPDIKWLRRQTDIPALVSLQRQLLTTVWSLLKPNGRLLYATCSLLKIENQQQMQWFVEQTGAQIEPIAVADHNPADIGFQFLPDTASHPSESLSEPGSSDRSDGFYYCLLTKPV